MSQTAPGEAGGGGNPSHSSNKFFQQPFSAPVGTHFFSQGQGGAEYGSLIPHFPVKPTNPHMGNQYRPHGPMQFNMHSSHLNPQQETMHQFNMKARNDANIATLPHPYQQNHYGNVHYFSNGNYVTAVTLNPGEQQQQKQIIHPIQQQYMPTPQNYYTNCTGSPMMNQMNANVNYMQNMVIQQNVNKNIYSGDENCQKNKSAPEVILSSDKNELERTFAQDKENKTNESNSFSDSNSSKVNPCKSNANESLSVNSNGDANLPNNLQNVNENLQKSSGSNNNNLGNLKNSSISSSTNSLANNRPRTNSRCDSVRSEAGESTCSSLSTESMPDQNNVHHHNQHVFNVKNNQQYHFANAAPFPNQLQTANNFNTINNGNMNYQNYMPCQPRINQVIAKPGVYSNPNLIQAFQQVNTVQHIQVQHGQVQIMQQHYQSLQGPGVARQTMGMIPNSGIPQGQPNSVIVSVANNSVQGLNIPNSGMISDHSNTHDQNMNMAQNCIGHPGTVAPQNFSASTPHGQFLPQSVIQSQCKAPPGLLQQNMMMGITGPIPGGGNSLNKVYTSIVVVPFGWKRINNNGQIVYISPSGSELRSPVEVCDYLTQENTCKCGLQCPLRVENIFCFDPKIPHRLTTPEELSSGEATKACNHRRKLALAFSRHLQKHAKREDGRKKRKRKAAEPLESVISNQCSTIDQNTPVNQTIPFNHQTQQQDASQLQVQQQQQQVFQQNQQNWNGVYSGNRMMHPNEGISVCQGSPENFSSMNKPQGCSTAGPFVNQHNQNCCDSHQCFNNNHHRSKMMQQPMRHPFGGMNRPPFCRMPGVVATQGGCVGQQPMQQFIQHPMMVGNRVPTPIPNSPMCRLPVNSNVQMFENGNISQGNDSQVMGQDAFPASKILPPEEGDKRRRGSNARSRKKAKTTPVDRNSPCVNVDARNLRTENAISPHTGPGPPIFTNSQVTPHSSTDSQGVCASSNGPGASQGSLPVSGPSFMEDPNGYLAQQTVLLNNTMSGGGVGQFSPQGSRMSPRLPGNLTSQNNPLPSKTHQGFVTQTSTSDPKSHASPAVVPLPSNVPLPARVSKASNSAALTSTSAASNTGSLCASVHSKSSNCTNNNSNSKPESEQQDKSKTLIATAESSYINSTVTVTYTSSSVTTTTCGSESNSPHSSQDIENHPEMSYNQSELSYMKESNQVHTSQNLKYNKNVSSVTTDLPSKTSNNKVKNIESQRRKSDSVDGLNNGTGRSSIIINTGSNLSVEAANKPLTPGPAECTVATQSPLEMVQNIVSSIPLPASNDDLSTLPGKISNHHHHHHASQLIADQTQSIHSSLAPQHVTGPHVYNMTGSNGMTGVMYNPGGGAAGMLRGTGSLVLHGAGHTGTIPPGVLVSNSGSMVVVTSPFNTKVSVAAPVVCSNVSGITSMVGVQAVPQVQVQPSIANVQSHQLQSHLQQIQPVQPVVQFVNTFATMQAPVIIQNGSNIIQSPSGVLSGHGGVLGPASIIPSSTQTFVTSQPLLAVDSSTHSSHMQMAHVVTSASSEGSDDSGGNRLTPIATPASTPTTPHSTPGSETPPSGCSSNGSGRKRKRRRNVSTPQGIHQQSPQQQHLVPAIIMSKQLPQQMVVSGSQISQVAPYGSVTGAQVATVATMGGAGSAGSAGSQMLTTAGQPTNSINVVQMVGGPVAGPLPVHLQQPHTIIVPSAATPGVIINQLSDGTFVSTDPASGVTYPVQLQLSGSHIVGVSPVGNSNTNVVSSIAAPSSIPQETVMAVRHSPHTTSVNANTKLISISPGVSSSQSETLVSNVYGVSTNPVVSHSGIIATPVETEYHHPNSTAFTQHLQQANQTEDPSMHQPLMVANANATLLQRKTTTIVAQQTTLVATQGGIMGTHSSVSTQTPGLLGESDVTSSDCVANPREGRDVPESLSHQSAEVTTTRHDEDVSTPESLLVSPQGQSSPESSSKKTLTSRGMNQGQEPHSATAASVENGMSDKSSVLVLWGFHRGQHYWPAQFLHQSGGEVTVQWYGDHSVEKVPFSSLSNSPANTKKVITRRRLRGMSALDEAIAEARRMMSFTPEESMYYSDTVSKNASGPNEHPTNKFLPNTFSSSSKIRRKKPRL